MSKSRQNKKIWKKALIICDIASIPRNEGVDFDMWMNLARNHGVLLYDSTEGSAPRVTPRRYSVKFKNH